MKIRRFQERDARTAMARVREELGPEAVILSNKSVNGQVELVAAVDLDEAALEQSRAAGPPAGAAGLAQHGATGAALEELQRELGNLRSMIEHRLGQLSWRDVAGRPPARGVLQARLAALGLSRTLCGVLSDILPADGDADEYWEVALQMLAGRLPVMRSDALLSGGGMVALMGVTGVGKTTLIAKLAARCLARQRGAQLALVTTDCYRIGGQEQLRTIARYLDVPVAVATDVRELRATLDQLASRHLVLIDTAGMSQRDPRLAEQYRMLRSVGHKVDTYLVLPATAQLRALREMLALCGEDAPAGVLVSKVDESVNLGAVLDVVLENRLPLAYVSSGQKVPDDLAPADVQDLIDRAVALAGDEVAPHAGRPAAQAGA